MTFKAIYMAEFILLIREDLSKYPRPEAELQALIKAHTGWAKELSARGIFKTGYGVDSEGKILSLKKDEIQVEPLRDVKEGVGGFYIIEVDDMDQAIAVAKECPTYKDGDSVEVRMLS